MSLDQGPIPVLDLHSARQADGSFSPEFIEQLRHATHNVGFFQITGYGGRPGQAEQLLDIIRRFFNLPLDERMKLDNRLSPHFRGYTRMGTEVTQGRADAREQIDYSPDREPVPEVPADQPYWLLQGPNLWPGEAFPELRPAAMEWAALMSGVGMELLRAIAVSLQLPEDYFDEPFRDAPAWMGKLVHYVGGVVEAAGDQGVGSHADYGFVTLLLQDNVGGLEVLPPGTSRWLPVEPLPGALVVNLGEMLEVATEGYLAATIHRVQAPPPGVDRYSVPFFWSPRLDAVIQPVPLAPELKAAARGITDDPANPLLASFGMNMLKGRMRAHPDVTERHYPELMKR
ncbi:isopenicillin N synthase family oxygenase [Pseudarthrobacter sp. AG30]|uniref:isopenicillin N synthase family dioxygenase n=1 Tax=unclassified Pseudarthrobacter TaxID=2647000 RepID=UPI000D65092E|nr:MULTISPECIES: 2-oxoglutarate and iron-dependent oxygenase domain-containing protein [unclassified Pseudarthrobacter]RAX16126.1 isopenicillin N synthase family oxygenase [Pseudarthrobacter sp. AG30]